MNNEFKDSINIKDKFINSKVVNIFYTNINDCIKDYPRYRILLNKDELNKADRYYFEKDRICYTVARAKLKQLLSLYTDLNPEKIVFKYNDYGKPYIDNNIKFNISHSKDYIVYAFSCFDIGIDIEYMKENIKYKELIHRYFSKLEIEEFLTVSEEKQKEAFFNGWSRKEAYIKAVGKGLSIPLNSFDVSLAPNKKAEIINIDSKKNKDWIIHDLHINNEYKSAFVVNLNSIENINIRPY